MGRDEPGSSYDFFAPSGRSTPPNPYLPAAPAGADPLETQLLATSRQESLSAMGTAYPTRGRLGFRRSLSSGLQLAGTCGRVVAAEPVTVVVSAVSLLLTVAVAVGYAQLAGGFASLLDGGKVAVAVKTFPLMAALCCLGVVSAAVVVDLATTRLQGGRPHLLDSWVRTLSRLPQLVGFGLVLAGERTLTNMLRGRRRFSPGTVAANMIDRAWDFATFLAVPVVLYEGLGPLAAVRRSAQLVRHRWGSQLTATAVLNVAVFVLGLPVVAVAGFVGFAVAPVVGVVMLLLAVAGVMTVAATLSGVLSAAMYRFALTGQVVPGFTEADMWAVFTGR